MTVGQQKKGIGEEIYRRFLDGDADAMEELVEFYVNGLILFICGLGCDARSAEEIAIDTFAQLISGGYKNRASLKTYLYTIGRNLTIRHLKRLRGETHASLDDVAVKCTQVADHPENQLLLDERKLQLCAAMRKLKREYYAVLQLLYFEDMSYVEAGKILHKTSRQIGDFAYRAKAALKKTLEDEGFTYEEL